jgi:hypothetical protein
LYLRQFSGLRSVALAGNPLCSDERYAAFVAAFLPVRFLDFRRVPDEAVPPIPFRLPLSFTPSPQLTASAKQLSCASKTSSSSSKPRHHLPMLPVSYCCFQTAFSPHTPPFGRPTRHPARPADQQEAEAEELRRRDDSAATEDALYAVS